MGAIPPADAGKVDDPRSALALLEPDPRHYLRTAEPVDPRLELAGIYRLVGAGTPVKPPARIGPAMVFEHVAGYPDMRIAVGVLASRERTALLLGTTVDRLPFRLLEALERPLAPVLVEAGRAPCQEVLHREPVELMRLLPVPTNTAQDAGPYLCLGLMHAEDPETSAADVTVHRMCVLGPGLLSVYFVPGRHIDQFRMKAEAAGRALPVSVNIGLDPGVDVPPASSRPPHRRGSTSWAWRARCAAVRWSWRRASRWGPRRSRTGKSSSRANCSQASARAKTGLPAAASPCRSSRATRAARRRRCR